MSQSPNTRPAVTLGRAIADVRTLLSGGYDLQAPLSRRVLAESLPLLRRSRDNARAVAMLARYEEHAASSNGKERAAEKA